MAERIHGRLSIHHTYNSIVYTSYRVSCRDGTEDTGMKASDLKFKKLKTKTSSKKKASSKHSISSWVDRGVVWEVIILYRVLPKRARTKALHE